MKKIKPILVTGLPRSGTTFLSTILKECNDLFYFDEPFNKLWGLKNIKHFYPSPNSYYKTKVDSLFNNKFEFSVGPKKNNLKYLTKKIFGNKIVLSSLLYKYFFYKKKKLLIKDPTAAFLSNYFQEKHNCKIIVIIRHPMAFINSQIRMSWDIKNFNDFLNQHEIKKFLKKSEINNLKKKLSYFERNAYMWLVVNKIILKIYENSKNKSEWLIVRHEDISNNPQNEFKKIFSFLKIDFNEKIKKKIQKLTNGKIINPKKGVYLSMVRNSKKITKNWKNKFTSDEIKLVKKITYKISNKFYKKNDW